MTPKAHTKRMWYWIEHFNGKTEIIETVERPKGIYDGGDCIMISAGFDTLAKLQERYGLTENCRICGQLVSTCWIEPTKQQCIERKLCFSCNSWTNTINTPADNRAIIDHHLYTIGREPRKGEYTSFLGFGGREFHIEFFNGLKVVSHNLWSGGAIPERFWEQLPDNARFLDGAKKEQVGYITCWSNSTPAQESLE